MIDFPEFALLVIGMFVIVFVAVHFRNRGKKDE